MVLTALFRGAPQMWGYVKLSYILYIQWKGNVPYFSIALHTELGMLSHRFISPQRGKKWGKFPIV